MNILLLTHQGDIAGSTYSISYLAKGLAARGHNVYVGCREAALLYRLLQGTPVHCLPMSFHSKFDRQNMKQVRDAVKEYHIDLINPQSGKDRYNTAFAKLWYKLDVLVVHTRRQRPLSSGGRLQAWFYNTVTDKIVAVSNPIAQALVAFGIKPSHVKVIHNGTPAEKYEQLNPKRTEKLRAQYHISIEDQVVGCVGRHKQQEQLLGALHYIAEPVKLVLVGVEEPQFANLLAHIPQQHQVICTGLVPAEEVLDHYPLFHVKVLPSVIEGLSQSLLEAMAMGVPVIATNAAGNPDLIQHEINGLLFREGDVKQLAEQIQQLLKEGSLRSRLIEAAKKTALEDFSITRTVEHYEHFFAELIAEKKS